MMKTDRPISTTGQYMYISLTHEKLSHINNPRRKIKKHET
jgi:hypothetical protein